MLMLYLLFIVSLIFIRLLSGYDSRYQSGKYIRVKNSVLSKVLLDSMSLHGRKKRPAKDRNKMTVWGVALYIAAGAVLLVNIVMLLVPRIPVEPWGIETDRFLVYTDTLNGKISAIGILFLFLTVMIFLACAIIQYNKETQPKWLKVFVWTVASVMILSSALVAFYLLGELVASFL